MFLNKHLRALESNKVKGNLHRLMEPLKEDGVENESYVMEEKFCFGILL